MEKTSPDDPARLSERFFVVRRILFFCTVGWGGGKVWEGPEQRNRAGKVIYCASTDEEVVSNDDASEQHRHRVTDDAVSHRFTTSGIIHIARRYTQIYLMSPTTPGLLP